MSIDVSYQGLPIARGAGLHLEPPGVYIEMDGPMPVGTRLALSYEGHRLEGRVARVNEGVGPGMVVVPAEGGDLPRWITQVKPRVVQTVEIEAESELDAVTPSLPVFAPERMVELVSKPEAEASTVPAPAVQAAPTPTTEQAAPAEPPPTPEAEPAPAVTESSRMPPYEATQEMAIPSLDDEARTDSDGNAPRETTEKRTGKKKKSPPRRR